MNILRSYCLLLCAVLLLSGFSWGFRGDSCKSAMELADKLETMRDDVQLRQAEAKIESLCSDGAAAHYVMALKLERVGNLDGAMQEYRQALLQQRVFPKASGNLGLLYAQTGRSDEALVELTRGLTSSSNPKYHKALGRILADAKVYPLAIYHLGEAGNGMPNDPEIFTTLAEVRLAMGQPAKAMEDYRLALSADPASEKAHTGIARIYLDRNEPDKALEELKKAEMANPQNRQVHLLMAGIYEKKGDRKLAEYEYLLGGKGKQALKASPVITDQVAGGTVAATDFDKAVEALKGTLKESPDKAVLVYENLGNLYRSAGRDTEAIGAYKEAVYRNSTSSDLYMNLGILYEKHAKLDEAVVAYKQAIQIKPENAAAHLRLADIHNSRGSHVLAVEQYGEFLKLKPESPDIQLKLARILTRNKEFSLAIDAYNAVLKSSPDNLDANREIAQLYKSKGLNDKAVEHFKKVLAHQKDDAEARNALVSIYVKNKQYDEITDLLKGTAELFPDDPTNHYKLGLIYEFRKDYDNAIASYKKAGELKPDHARSLNALGRLYMKTGRISEAKVALEAAKKADPSLEEASVLLNNVRDEFSPEPRKINNSFKATRVKKGRKGKKAISATKRSKSGKAKKASSSKKAAPKRKGSAKSKKR